MKQFTFLQEGSNRILSKVQKSFWSCTHVNSFQKYALYVNLHNFIEYLIQNNPKNPKINEIQQVHQEIHAKQFLIILFKLFSIGDSFKFNATQETRLI